MFCLSEFNIYILGPMIAAGVPMLIEEMIVCNEIVGGVVDHQDLVDIRLTVEVVGLVGIVMIVDRIDEDERVIRLKKNPAMKSRLSSLFILSCFITSPFLPLL